MPNGGPEWRFQASFEPSADDGGEFHGTWSTLMSRASLAAAPRFILASGRGCSIQPGLNDIKDENAILSELDLFRLPGGFVVVLGVLPVEADFIIIGGDPFFAEATNGRPSFAEDCLLIIQCRFLYDG